MRPVQAPHQSAQAAPQAAHDTVSRDDGEAIAPDGPAARPAGAAVGSFGGIVFSTAFFAAYVVIVTAVAVA